MTKLPDPGDITAVEHLSLGPGDVLVIRLSATIDEETRTEYVKVFTGAFPNNLVIIIDKRVDLVRVSSATAETILNDLEQMKRSLE